MARKQGTSISETKARKIAVGGTIAGTLLLVFLIVILIVQFVQIGVAKAEENELDENIEKYQQLIERDADDLEYYRTQEALYRLALSRGWKSNH